MTSIVLPILLWCQIKNMYVILILIVTLWSSAIGFFDDYLKDIKKVSKGLIGRYKILGQVLLGTFIGLMLYFFPQVPEIRSATTLPFLGLHIAKLFRRQFLSLTLPRFDDP